MAATKQYRRGCPRCHGDVYMIDGIGEGGKHVYVLGCLNEKCGLGTRQCATMKEAIDAWKEELKRYQ